MMRGHAGWVVMAQGRGGLLGLLRAGLRFAVQEAAALALTTSDHCLLAGVAGASTAVIAPRAVSFFSFLP